ncbi:hypothetical protein NQ315_007281 [Exocentrus adspersus]|uniref:Uncharacterized protein n=1 Tax=Exocentrus adspersus TaxID=1586481 RepID=A0AAV8WD53_9CUCU|nr:hypothetical protein NQ315_007281 [Exocentrus adspersus]
MLRRQDDPLCGGTYKFLPVPSQKYYLDYNTYDPLGIYEPWKYRYLSPYSFPYYTTFDDYYLPSSYALRRLRSDCSNILKSLAFTAPVQRTIYITIFHLGVYIGSGIFQEITNQRVAFIALSPYGIQVVTNLKIERKFKLRLFSKGGGGLLLFSSSGAL